MVKTGVYMNIAFTICLKQLTRKALLSKNLRKDMKFQIAWETFNFMLMKYNFAEILT